MLTANARWQQEIVEGFQVPSHYGVDEGVFLTTFDQPGVSVPRIDLQLSTQQVYQLQQLFFTISISLFVKTRHSLATLHPQ